MIDDILDRLDGKGPTGVAAVLFIITMIALVILPNDVTGIAFAISAILLFLSFFKSKSRSSLKVKFR